MLAYLTITGFGKHLYFHAQMQLPDGTPIGSPSPAVNEFYGPQGIACYGSVCQIGAHLEWSARSGEWLVDGK